MSKTGALYWLFFLGAVATFIVVSQHQSQTLTYLLPGILIVMTGLIKLDNDRAGKAPASPQPAEGQTAKAEAMDQMAKKMIVLENQLGELKALVTDKYAVRSGKVEKKKKLVLPPEDE